MYWVQLKTRNAKAARKSRGLRYPAHGRSRKPVFFIRKLETFESYKKNLKFRSNKNNKSESVSLKN